MPQGLCGKIFGGVSFAKQKSFTVILSQYSIAKLQHVQSKSFGYIFYGLGCVQGVHEAQCWG